MLHERMYVKLLSTGPRQKTPQNGNKYNHYLDRGQCLGKVERSQYKGTHRGTLGPEVGQSCRTLYHYGQEMTPQGEAGC